MASVGLKVTIRSGAEKYGVHLVAWWNRSRLRSWWDYLLFLIVYQPALKTTFIFLDLGTLTVATVHVLMRIAEGDTTPVGKHEAVGLFTLCWIIARSAVGIYRWLKGFHSFRNNTQLFVRQPDSIKHNENVIPLDQISPSVDDEVELGYKRLTLGSSVMMVSDVISSALRTGMDWKIRPNHVKRKEVQAKIRKNRDFCLTYLTSVFNKASQKKGSQFTNEKKLCLHSDLRRDPAPDGACYVDCNEGWYFESVCIDEACTAIMIENEWRVSSGGKLFPREGKHLLSLDQAAANQHIGISTLAITADNYVALWRQGVANQQEAGKLTTTGSGSANYADRVPESLQATIKKGMERELQEETKNLSGNESETSRYATSVLGFYRWVKRAGKPEFVGITRIGSKKRHLKPDEVEVYHVDQIDSANIGGRNFYKVNDVAEILTMIKEVRSFEFAEQAEHRYELSMSLKACFYYIEQLATTEAGRKWLSEAFFGTPSQAQ